MKRRRHVPLPSTKAAVQNPSFYQNEVVMRDDDIMVRLYRAELALLQRRRKGIQPSASPTSSDDDVTLLQASKRMESAANILKNSLSSSLVSFSETMEAGLLPSSTSETEVTNGSKEIPPNHFRLLPVVSGVEFSKITLLGLSWNGDRSIQFSSFRLDGSFLVPPPSIHHVNESFFVCLDVEHRNPVVSNTNTTTPLPFEFGQDNCSISRLRDCSIGNRNNDHPSASSMLWTENEMDQITRTAALMNDDNNDDDGGNPEFMSTTKNFPLWLRNAQQFVEFAHKRARWIREWQQKYPNVFGALTASCSSTTTASFEESPVLQPDCLNVWMPLGRNATLTPSTLSRSTRATAASAGNGSVVDCTVLRVQWSWSFKAGHDFIQVLSASDQVEEAVSPTKKQRVLERKHHRPRHFEKEEQTTSITLANIRDGLQSLLQFARGDCGQALELLLGALSKKHDASFGASTF